MMFATKMLVLMFGFAGSIGTATVEGTLSKDEIRDVVRAHIDEVRVCYNAALKVDPQAQGRVEFDFTIGTEGAVTEASVKSSTMKDTAAPVCIRDAIKTWKFPKPQGGSVAVTYPFLLEPG